MARWVPRALALAFAVFAYRPLVIRALAPPTVYELESWLFRPSQLPVPLVIAVAAWLLWRRHERITPAAPTPWARPAAGAFLAASAASYGWAALTRSPDLLLVSLAAGLLAFGTAARGPTGARALALPALALLLGVPIPVPLRHEIVWALQRATSFATALVLAPIRSDFLQEGVILRSGEHSFHVIDGCSGLQGIAILVLVALIVGELLALPARRTALLAAIAVPLGFALNVARIAYIASSANPEQYAGLHGDHTAQGLALLSAGVAALYAVGHAIGPTGPRAKPERSPRALGETVWWQTAIALAGLSALSLSVSPFAGGGAVQPATVPFPESLPGWSSEPIAGDPYFLPAGVNILYRRYSHRADPDLIDAIDVLIAVDQDPPLDDSEAFSSKLRWPGPDWQLESRRRARVWDLGRDADLAIAARKSQPERAVVYTWKVRDEGILRESARSLLSLDQSPWRRARRRATVRLVAFAPTGASLAIDRAKRRLDGFAAAFRAPFTDL